jgi:lysophospholipase L1-like esterase
MCSILCLMISAASAAAAPAPAPEPASHLPVVVLIGDSIRLGYAPFVAERLKGKAEVVSMPESADGVGDTSLFLKNLDAWAIAPKARVIHFNSGLHDLKVDPKSGQHQVELGAYMKNLAEIRRRLEGDTSARLIFATSTPVLDQRHNAVKPFQRREADVEAYNQAALQVLASPPTLITIDDLHAVATKLGLESALDADGVHFTKAAYEALGAQVAGEIEKALADPPVNREVTCRWADQPPVLDGKLDDPVWGRGQVIDHFPAFWKGEDTGTGTRAILMWDNDALYFAGTMTDAELRAFGTKRNDRLWLGDVFELFFKPDAEKPAYYEFQVNPRSVILELAFPKRGAAFETLAAAPPMGMQAVAVVDGTLDQPGDRDKSWSVEGRIPWTAFAPTGGRPAPAAAWLFALCRYDYGPEGTKPITMSSAPLTRPSFHRYEDYGRLIFEGPKR